MAGIVRYFEFGQFNGAISPVENPVLLPKDLAGAAPGALSSSEWEDLNGLREGDNRFCVGDLLAVEELAGEVGRAWSVGLVEDFVKVRGEQALAGRVACACGCSSVSFTDDLVW